MQLELMAFVIGVLVVLVLGCLVSLFGVVYLARQNRQLTDPQRHFQTDPTSMMIMFSTMRDFLSDQKHVAIQFNKSLDRKIKLVREMIDEAKRERVELRKAQHRIAAALARVHEELGLLGEPVDDIAPPKATIVDRYAPATEWTGQQEIEGEDALEQAHEPAARADDFIDSWTGVDLGIEDIEEEEFAIHHEPERPENEAAARDAFRSLLNIEGGQSVDKPFDSGNGSRDLSPLELQVYQYDDAGMRAAEIARELGVEKSHVRAILAKRAAGS